MQYTTAMLRNRKVHVHLPVLPSLARSVPKAFKMGQEREGKGEGAKRHYALSSVVRYEVRLPQVNCEK